MEYIGMGNRMTVESPKADTKGNSTMPFNYGDTLSYTGYAYIENTEFTSATVKKAQYNSELIPLNFTLQPFLCGIDSVTDYDGNTYTTMEIGSQCWMKENLRTTHFADGTAIALGGLSPSTTTPYRYCPRGHDSEVPKFGHLYNWAAAMHGAVSSEANPSGVQGICPTGWHLPSDAEWQQLNGYVSSHNEYSCGGDSFNIAKALASTKHWVFSYSECAVGNNPKDNNATGFSALPAGYNEGQIFEWAVFWSASQPQPQYGNAHYAGFNHGTSILLHTGAPYGVAFGLQLSSSASVRCLRD